MALTNIEGFSIDVEVKRVRSLRMAVRRDGTLRLSVPYGVSAETVRSFVKANAAWIEKHTAMAQEHNQREEEKVLHRFEENEPFTFLGQEYPLHYIFKETPLRVELCDGALCVTRPKNTASSKVKDAVNAWYFRQMKAVIDEMLAYWLPVMGEKPLAAVRYKTMKSRWGSCKPSQRIVCFNMRLVFYPRKTIEAIVVHELCHLKERSHNARFHALMAHYLPDYKEREKPLSV